MNTQDDIRNRVIGAGVCMHDHPSPECQAIQDRARLLGALDAILALHTEDEQGKCAECTVAPFSVHSVKWPCPTVAAVHDALEAGK